MNCQLGKVECPLFPSPFSLPEDLAMPVQRCYIMRHISILIVVMFLASGLMGAEPAATTRPSGSIGPDHPVKIPSAGMPQPADGFPRYVVETSKEMHRKIVLLAGDDWLNKAGVRARLVYFNDGIYKVEVLPSCSMWTLHNKEGRWTSGFVLTQDGGDVTGRVDGTQKFRTFGTFTIESPSCTLKVDYVVTLKPKEPPESDSLVLPVEGEVLWSNLRVVIP